MIYLSKWLRVLDLRWILSVQWGEINISAELISGCGNIKNAIPGVESVSYDPRSPVGRRLTVNLIVTWGNKVSLVIAIIVKIIFYY